jgi:hypothetical protein
MTSIQCDRSVSYQRDEAARDLAHGFRISAAEDEDARECDAKRARAKHPTRRRRRRSDQRPRRRRAPLSPRASGRRARRGAHGHALAVVARPVDARPRSLLRRLMVMAAAGAHSAAAASGGDEQRAALEWYVSFVSGVLTRRARSECNVKCLAISYTAATATDTIARELERLVPTCVDVVVQKSKHWIWLHGVKSFTVMLWTCVCVCAYRGGGRARGGGRRRPP